MFKLYYFFYIKNKIELYEYNSDKYKKIMKVSYDFELNKLIELENGKIQLPDKDNFTILAIKVVKPTNVFVSDVWLLDETDVEDQMYNLYSYYYEFSTYYKNRQNVFDEELESDLHEQYESELNENISSICLNAVKGLKLLKNKFQMGNYTVFCDKYIHPDLDSHYFFNFKRNK